jgi:hypothetical protein
VLKFTYSKLAFFFKFPEEKPPDPAEKGAASNAAGKGASKAGKGSRGRGQGGVMGVRELHTTLIRNRLVILLRAYFCAQYLQRKTLRNCLSFILNLKKCIYASTR